jgi:hypothetical protein
MSTEGILSLCDRVKRESSSIVVHQLATEVEDLLAEAAPCGYAEPYATADGLVVVPDEWGGTGDPERVRHMARMLLRAADEAEGT